jgi:hypothetical protein
MNLGKFFSKAVLPCCFIGIAAVSVGGCSSKGGSTAAKGAGAKTATEALKSGQKAGKNLKENESKSTDKGHSAGGAGRKKNGGAHTAAAAKAAGEKAGSKALGDKEKATDKGVSLASADDGAGTDCDSDHEGEGFCGDDAHIDFCKDGHWYALDCAAEEDGAFCGEDLGDHTVDCFVETELVVTAEVVDCDDSSQGAAFCEDDGHALFCDSGEWHELSCGDIYDSGICLEDPDSLGVDCAVEGDHIELASRTPRLR